MKTINSFLAILMAVSFISVANAQSTKKLSKETIQVWGNCEMCKSGIEKAAKNAGATSADWNVDTKMLAVTFPTEKISLTTIEEKVAAVGHDTKNYTAPAAAYIALAGCCKYERKTSADVSVAPCCANGCTMGDCCNTNGTCKDNCQAVTSVRTCCKAAALKEMTCTKGASCCASSKKS
ncbi:MAG: hypothetical protein LH478_13540 [Chitinophagaceae bacterium]|nr:hypothetical protein [Chitinophagaceae bacterium]